jgi:KaiC/GvpD/RAD55 family RecA-like ATPase
MDVFSEQNNMNSGLIRTKTGINKLDEITQGGFPRGSFVVVTGTAGSGKTIFACQFLKEGVYNNEKSLFITAEQTANDVKEQASQFGWDFNTWENEGKIKIVSLIGKQLWETKAMEEIKQLIQQDNYDRIVFDSIPSILNASFSGNSIIDYADRGFQPNMLNEMSKSNVTNFIDFIKQNNITTLGISQKIEGMPGDTLDNISEFKADGLVVMNYAAIGTNLNRTIQIKKLRKTRIDGIPHTFDFTENGIFIQGNEE